MSATRVMATCALVGQAVGTAAAIAVREGLCPRGVYKDRLDELQQTLMDDDSWLPWKTRSIPELTRTAALTASEGDPSALINGIDRPVGDEDNGWYCGKGGWILFELDKPADVDHVRFTFDSDLNRTSLMPSNYPLDMPARVVPETITKRFRVEALDGNGTVISSQEIDNNYQRLVRTPVGKRAHAVRVTFEETWGTDTVHVFACDVR
jgi:hypothetical protein